MICYNIAILRQTASMVINPIMVHNFAPLFLLHDGGSVLRLSDGSLLSVFQVVGAWLSMSVVGLIVVLFVVFFCPGFRSPLNPLLCFSTVFLIIRVSLWWFTDEVEDPYADQTYICILELHQNLGIKHGFSCINIRQVPWEVLKTEAEGRGFQHLPRDLANVTALKNHVWSLLLH